MVRSILAIAAAVFVLASCASPLAQPAVTATPAPVGSPTPSTFTDPFAYCATVGTVDKPDARYAGAPVPDAIISGFKEAAGLVSSTEPDDQFRKSTIWRCMDGKVYACNFGANLQCDSQAETNKTPTQAMSDFCSANPNSDFIPLSVVGHSSIYSWKCVNGAAEVLDQVDQPDARGFLSRIWYPLHPSP